MGIDLTKVFKSDDSTVKPSVSALVVFAHPDETVTTSIRDAIQQAGFAVDRVQKSDEGETVVYAQGTQKGETTVVRLSDQMLVSVVGLKTPDGWAGEMVEHLGFYPDLKTATSTLQDQMQLVAKSETPQEDATAVLTSYASYLDQLLILPSACFKADEAVSAIIKKCSCEEQDDKDDDKEEAEKGEKKAKNPAAEAIKEETEADKKKRAKNHPPAEMAPPDEDDDQKPPPDEAQKADFEGMMTALKGMEARTTAQLTALSQKLETVASEQATHKKTLDGVVEKADTFENTLKATVTAVPTAEDRPSGVVRMRVQKDDDPRTGNFDTAFLRRRK